MHMPYPLMADLNRPDFVQSQFVSARQVVAAKRLAEESVELHCDIFGHQCTVWDVHAYVCMYVCIFVLVWLCTCIHAEVPSPLLRKLCFFVCERLNYIHASRHTHLHSQACACTRASFSSIFMLPSESIAACKHTCTHTHTYMNSCTCIHTSLSSIFMLPSASYFRRYCVISSSAFFTTEALCESLIVHVCKYDACTLNVQHPCNSWHLRMYEHIYIYIYIYIYI